VTGTSFKRPINCKSTPLKVSTKALHPAPSGTPIARERLLRYLASALSEVFRSRSFRNIFIFGKPGTGKTLCVQYVLDQVKSYRDKMRLDLGVVYMNARRTRSPYYTMLEIPGHPHIWGEGGSLRVVSRR